MKNIIFHIKKIFIKFLKFFGLKIIKINRDRSNLDRLHKIFLKDISLPIIIDVGANVGQTILRFKNLNNRCFIHSFEPVENDYKVLQKKFNNNKSIFLNNCALGEKTYKKKLYINNLSGSSSFNKLTPNTEWIKKRSFTNKVDPREVFQCSTNCDVITLDDYCEKNSIKKIDVLKIDAQGYEDKILEGAKKIIKAKIVNYIELEIIFNNVYEKKLSFLDIEKNLIPFGYELFAISNPGNYYDDYIFQVDVIYFNRAALTQEKIYIYEELNKRFKYNENFKKYWFYSR